MKHDLNFIIPTQLIQEIGNRLFERLDFIKLNPATLLNLSNNTEVFSPLLQSKYALANILNMGRHFLQPALKSQSIDGIFSNCLLEWSTDLLTLLTEIKRILKPEGCLLFSTFGPDSPFGIPCLDMHDVGDALIEYQFLDPVMDAEYIQVDNLKFEIIYGLAWNTNEPIPPTPDFSHKIPITIL